MLMEGVLISAYPKALPSWLYHVAFTLPPGSEALVMVLTGFAVSGLGVVGFGQPELHRLDGAAIWVFLFVSNLTALVSGFYIGAFLAAIGASHMFWWKPTPVGGAAAIKRSFVSR
ncbi:MAG: hypothetical protein L3K23_02260 [Thermoplasmata archaeon]|nr:hypothetical protein [Thermoplasmata archaeon]